MKARYLVLPAALLALAGNAVAQEGFAPPPPPPGEEGAAPGGPRGPRGNHFAEADTNKDGYLTKDEMLAQHKARLDKMFAEADTNKDGKLSKDEMEAARGKFRERMREHMQERRPDAKADIKSK